MKPTAKIAIVAGFVIAALVIVFIAKSGGKNDAKQGTDTGSQKTPDTPKGGTKITVVYSTEKKDWMEASAQAFAKEHPEIKVELVGKGSLDAAQAILDGTLQPAVWSPADSMVMNLLV